MFCFCAEQKYHLTNSVRSFLCANTALQFYIVVTWGPMVLLWSYFDETIIRGVLFIKGEELIFVCFKGGGTSVFFINKWRGLN